MPGQRQVHLTIGVVVLVVSFVLSWGRYAADGEHGGEVVAVALIFGVVAASIAVVLVKDRVGAGLTVQRLGNAGFIRLALLVVAAIIAEGIDRSLFADPVTRLVIATLAGAGIGVVFGQHLGLGGSSAPTTGFVRTAPRRGRREER
ncbi:hypothetical protein ACOCJ4_16065 [Knoellia sp. CPCC 206435]|uniref:hypothetical protein n=1 Tax=Knoellia terrae TaxID=3404797 RepID=UPI003B42AF72